MKWKFKLNTPIDSRGHAQRTQEVSGTNRCVYVIRHNDISTTPTSRPPPHTDLPPTPDRPNKRRIKHLANKQLGLGLRGSTHWQAQRLNKFLVAWWPPQGVPVDIHSPLPLQIKVYIYVCTNVCIYDTYIHTCV